MLIKVNSAFKFTIDRGHTIIDGNPDDATGGVYEVPAAIGAGLIRKERAILFEGKVPNVKPVANIETTDDDTDASGWKGDSEAGITESAGEDELDVEETSDVDTVDENTDGITEEYGLDIKASLESVIAECKGKDDAVAKSLLDDWAMENAGGHIDKRKSVDNICETLKELVSDNGEG